MTAPVRAIRLEHDRSNRSGLSAPLQSPPFRGTGGATAGAVHTGVERGLEQTPADVLLTLAAKVERLAPSHRNPFAFHEMKSEIAHELRQLAAGRIR
jgi:hypothetical protein